jgi:hypothetical protein
MLHGSATRCMSHGTCAVVCLSHSNRLVCRRLASSLHTLRGPIHASQRCIGSVDYWLGAPMVHAAYRYAARCAPKTAEPGSPSSCAGRAARVATDASGSLRARARPQRRAAQRNTSARCLPAADQAACRMRRRQALHEHDRHCMRTAHTASERLNLRHPHAPHCENLRVARSPPAACGPLRRTLLSAARCLPRLLHVARVCALSSASNLESSASK